MSSTNATAPVTAPAQQTSEGGGATVGPAGPTPLEIAIAKQKAADASGGVGANAEAADYAHAHGFLTTEDAASLAKRAPSPLAEVDPLDVFTKQVKQRLLSRRSGVAGGRSVAGLFGGYG